MRRFRIKPEVSQERRSVFLVRAVDPVWAVTYKPMQPQAPIYDRREQMMYVLNNLGRQIPVKPISLVSDGNEENDYTMGAIVDGFKDYELEVWSNDWAFLPTDAPMRTWLDRQFGTDPWEIQGTIVVVVDQKNYDRWCEELKIPNSVNGSCILRITSPTDIESVA